ncbi:hypothetical protein DFH05DRAFT_1521661 [Lentinula detonsa]|uniref:Uncharacterized protein n=1 Tax=Lentinula detonsa TaxID=2804962 RepID=A0A9W8TZZ2_9AGAR|nr:hypothetical protein DFH05DRAFT_1521661 [Lentinula detonsa]
MSTETIHNPRYNLRRPGQSQRQGTPASAASVNDETQAQHRPTSYNEAAQGGRMTPKGDGNTPSDGESVAGSLKDEQHKLVEPEDNSLTDDDENPNQWVQVGSRRRATSLDSSQLYKIPLKSVRVKDANSGYSAKKVPVPITMAQGAVIREAEKGLSQAQRKMIAKRMKIVEQTPNRDNSDNSTKSEISNGEGPSTIDKGKGADPENWGAADMSDIDVNQQHEALDKLREIRKTKEQSANQKSVHAVSSEKPKKNSKHRAGSEALTDLVEHHIRDICYDSV